MNRPRPPQKLAIGSLETLDERIVPSAAGGITSLPIPTQEAFVTNRAGQALGSIFTQYVNYEAAGAKGSFTSTQAKQIYFSGSSVGVDITFKGGNFDTLVSQLESIGMKVTTFSIPTSTVEGYLPISELPVVASNGYATTIQPVYQPIVHAETSTPATSSNTTAANEALVNNRGGQVLGTIYTQYINFETAGGTGTFTSSLSSRYYLSGTSVGVSIRLSSSGNFSTLVSQLEEAGLQVSATSTQNLLVEGYLPIAELPVIANDAYVVGLSALSKPVSR